MPPTPVLTEMGTVQGISEALHFWPLVAAGHLCEKICKPFKITPPIFPRRVDWYRQNRAFKIEKAKRDLGYRPRVGIDEGLKATADWCRQEGFL